MITLCQCVRSIGGMIVTEEYSSCRRTAKRVVISPTKTPKRFGHVQKVALRNKF